MLDTVEDSHMFLAVDPKTKKTQAAYDVRKFYKGKEYDDADEYPDWDRRAQGLIDLGYAEEVVAVAE